MKVHFTPGHVNDSFGNLSKQSHVNNREAKAKMQVYK